MAKSGASEGEDGRSDLSVGNDLDTKDIGETRTTVVSEGAEDEVLSLLIEDEDAGQHDRVLRR
jgi:hypothetical protein